jgi:glutamate/tyrosine decarboxylase-like PLP-dependent enzyme
MLGQAGTLLRMARMNPKHYAMFLGPKGENAETLERLIVEALRDTVFWRRNFHPGDERLIPEKIKRADEFQEAVDVLEQELFSLLARLKRDIPFFSPRYIGHMVGDQYLPAVAGYFATMLHNPNNVSVEGSPATTELEVEAAGQLARLMGYGAEAWGHITAGGTIANIEALWVARNLKYLGLAGRETARELGIDGVRVQTCAGKRIAIGAEGNQWELLNLEMHEALGLGGLLAEAYRLKSGVDQREASRTVNAAMRRHSLSGAGIHAFHGRHRDVRPGAVVVPVTAHYSLQKAVEVLGLGTQQVRGVPVDGRFRADLGALREILDQCLRDRVPVIEMVSVMGTTEEGSVDALDEISAMRREFRKRGLEFFHHCDAAWGGYIRAMMIGSDGRRVPRNARAGRPVALLGADVYRAFEATGETDSTTIDPHKLGFIPYPCGAVLFRDARVRDLISFEASYVFHETEEGAKPFIGRYILEGSKPGAAAAACWLTHRVVPLDEDNHGAMVAMTIQGAQELYRCALELAPIVHEEGIALVPLTDPPDSNLFCFAVNRVGNTSLAEANRLNGALYDRLRFREEEVIQRHEFILSSTELAYAHYGMALPGGGNSMDTYLDRLGIPREEFARAGRIRILRCSISNPWIVAARGGKPDYVEEFAAVLGRELKRLGGRTT